MNPSQVIQLSNILKEKNLALQKLNTQLNITINKKDNTINILNTTNEEKDNIIKELNTSNEEKDNIIKELTDETLKKEKQTNEFKKDLKELEDRGISYQHTDSFILMR
jgi:SMC interacting uncharacterized protein involved in chromosome segregation